ncbi:MAG: hypothetical protein GX116_02740 [Fibrobacter sp.]|jgi:hypothetical protein|nr:hypothetical protein [Fibrobacter sp.]
MDRLILLFSFFLVFACKNQSLPLVYNANNFANQSFSLETSLEVMLDDTLFMDSMKHQGLNTHFILNPLLVHLNDDESAHFLMNVDLADSTLKQKTEEVTNNEQKASLLNFYLTLQKNALHGDAVTESDEIPYSFHKIKVSKMFFNIYPTFLKEKMEVGDSWENQQAVIDENHMQSTVYKNYHLEDSFKRKGVLFAKIRMNIKYKKELVHLKNTNKWSDFSVGTGTLLFNVNEGIIEEAELQMNSFFGESQEKGLQNPLKTHIIQKMKLKAL